jgi:hypothetical protein
LSPYEHSPAFASSFPLPWPKESASDAGNRARRPLLHRHRPPYFSAKSLLSDLVLLPRPLYKLQRGCTVRTNHLPHHLLLYHAPPPVSRRALQFRWSPASIPASIRLRTTTNRCRTSLRFRSTRPYAEAQA